MKTKPSMFALVTAIAAASAGADTTHVSEHIYQIDEGVTFTITADLANSFLFTWTDDSGTFTEIADPTLILSSGEIYIFDSISTHPFTIANGTLPVGGTHGSFFRTTTDGDDIDASTHLPIDDFQDLPTDPEDLIVWNIDDSVLGVNYFTCRNPGHLNMTGMIEVVEGAVSCLADVNSDGQLNFFDISAFLGAFTTMNPIVDFNNDGSFDFFDVSIFLNAFAAGCP